MALLDRELDLALALARRCGELAREIQAGGDATLQTRSKAEDHSPVTRADLAVEATIVQALRAQFPADAILAEESAASSGWGAHRRVWIIDPVDGTLDFARGDKSWAIHIGLAIDGVPALGVVHEPGHERLNWAIDHGGRRTLCTQQGRAGAVVDLLAAPAATADTNVAPHHRLVTSKSHRSERHDAVIARLEIGPGETLRIPSTGVKLCMLARGEASFYVHPATGTKLWDSCAPQVILHAAGGRLTDMRGDALVYTGPDTKNERGLLATAPGLDHDHLAAELHELAGDWFPRSL